MGIDSMIRSSLNAKRLTGVRVIGAVSRDSFRSLCGKFRGRTYSEEAMQQLQEQAKHDALMDLFVIKPRQSGFAAVAAATAAAINHPERTTILVNEGEDGGTADDRLQIDMLVDELTKHDVAVFKDADQAIAHINQMLDGE